MSPSSQEHRDLQSERRKSKRFPAPEMAFVMVRNGSSSVGHVIDVSKGGMAFKYLSERALHGETLEVDVLLSEYGFLWRRIPHRTILDIEILPEVPFSTIRVRRRAIAFEGFTQDDSSRLEFLLNVAEFK